MAAAPVKSPLHNFSLTFLKWGSKKDPQRCRRPPYDSPLSSPPPPSDHDKPEPSNSKGSRSSRNRRNNNPATPSTTTPHNEDEGEKKPKLGGGGEEGEADEKGWNLRPRRSVAMKGASTTSTTTNTTHGHTMGDAAGDNLPKSLRLRGLETLPHGGGGGGGGGEKREKKKFWIALSRDEIEEDIYSMTGLKPSRRPKKRPKTVQKQLDNIFPGLWMIGVSPESYRGLDVPLKR